MSSKIRFSSSVFPDGCFVKQFWGRESISNSFEFTVRVLCDKPDIDFSQAFGAVGNLEFDTQGTVHQINGVVAEIQLTDDIENSKYGYEVILRPRAWLWSMSVQNKVHQNASVQQMVQDVLGTYGDNGDPHGIAGTVAPDFRNSTGTDDKEFTIQYKESDLNFVERLLDHEGIFYYYLHAGQEDKFVVGDTPENFEALAVSELTYTRNDGSGLVQNDDLALVTTFLGKRGGSHASSQMLDYNYRNPDLDLTATDSATSRGVGVLHEYGANYLSADHGNKYATARANLGETQMHFYQGESNCGGVRSGGRTSLKDHHRGEYNQEYIVTEVYHSGEQEDESGGGFTYNNVFKAVPASVPYRPPLRPQKKPRMHGVMNGYIVGEQMHGRAEIDDKGRYKVRLPFDLSQPYAADGSSDGKSSCYIRMAQGFGGLPGDTSQNTGSHFPLLPGTEIVWACIEGDMDRPVICGVVPNPNSPSTVDTNNHQNNILRTVSGTTMTFNDGLENKPTTEPTPVMPSVVANYPGDDGTAFSVDVPNQWGKKTGLRLGGTEANTDYVSPVTATQANLFETTAGWFDYTDGDHVSYTKGSRTDIIEGGDYQLLITNGVQSTTQTSPVKVFKHQHISFIDNYPRETTVEFPNKYITRFGSLEIFQTGHKGDFFVGTANSSYFGAKLEVEAAGKVAAKKGYSVEYSTASKYDVTYESEAIVTDIWSASVHPSKHTSDSTKMTNMIAGINTTVMGALAMWNTAEAISDRPTGTMFGTMGSSIATASSVAALLRMAKKRKDEVTSEKTTAQIAMRDKSVLITAGKNDENNKKKVHAGFSAESGKEYFNVHALNGEINVGKDKNAEGVVIKSDKDSRVTVIKDSINIQVGNKSKVTLEKDKIWINVAGSKVSVNDKGIEIKGDVTIDGNLKVTKNVEVAKELKCKSFGVPAAKAKKIKVSKPAKAQKTESVGKKLLNFVKGIFSKKK